MNSVFTKNEIEIFKAWLLKKKNKEIADEMHTSEAYVSQTIKNIKEKITTLENSLETLNQMGLIPSREELRLTKKGKEYAEKAKEKFIEKSKDKSKIIDADKTLTELTGLQGFYSLPSINLDFIKKREGENITTVGLFQPIVTNTDPLNPIRNEANWTNIMRITRSPLGKSSSELTFNAELLHMITNRMITHVLKSDITEENKDLIVTLNSVIKNLNQLVEWLNSRGQLQPRMR